MATSQIIQTDPRLEQRRQLALAMMQQGQNAAPVQHWTQGANRIAQSLLGAYQARQAEQEQAEQQSMGREALAQAMQQLQAPSQPMIAGESGDEMAFDLGQPKADASAIQRFAQTLAANPYTSEYGSGLALQDALQQQQLQQRQGLGFQPSSVQEYEYFQKLNPEQRQQYLNLKRRGVQQVGGQLYDVASGEPRALLSPEQQLGQGAIQAQVKGGISQAQAQGAATGKSRAQKIADLPKIMANAGQAVALIDKAANHPGLSYAVGKSSMLPVIPGTEGANFMTVLDQLQGQNFLQAFESLKGGGQITELEGQKAQNAMGRLQRSQTEDEFKNSLMELRDIILAGAQRAQQGIVVDEPYTGSFSLPKTDSASGVASPTTQEEYDALPPGAVFIDPEDGKQYRKP